eukprot:scaffold11271_cov99-Isochrysis_galbana.AAC.2
MADASPETHPDAPCINLSAVAARLAGLPVPVEQRVRDGLCRGLPGRGCSRYRQGQAWPQEKSRRGRGARAAAHSPVAHNPAPGCCRLSLQAKEIRVAKAKPVPGQ